jgi:hypothetical protein
VAICFETSDNKVMVIAHTIHSGKFTFHTPTKTFVAEASDFGSSFEDLFSRVYDDACDVGFKLRSDKTGKEVIYYFEKEERDNVENELVAWVFTPASESIREVSQASGTSVKIYND